MAISMVQGAERLLKLGRNMQEEVPKHAVKAVATRFKHTVMPLQTTHTFKNFGGTGKSSVGVGVHFKLSGSGSSSMATVTTYGPFGILEDGAREHIIIPIAARGVVGNRARGQFGPNMGRTRTRRSAEGMVSRRLAKGRGFRSLEGRNVGVLKQHALKFPNGGFAPYAKHKGTKAHHPWAKGISIISPQAELIFEKSLIIGMAKTLL